MRPIRCNIDQKLALDYAERHVLFERRNGMLFTLDELKWEFKPKRKRPWRLVEGKFYISGTHNGIGSFYGAKYNHHFWIKRIFELGLDIYKMREDYENLIRSPLIGLGILANVGQWELEEIRETIRELRDAHFHVCPDNELQKAIDLGADTTGINDTCTCKHFDVLINRIDEMLERKVKSTMDRPIRE